MCDLIFEVLHVTVYNIEGAKLGASFGITRSLAI